MKLFESEHFFNYPWDQVTAANWQKYPNELSTHVISVDILDRQLLNNNQTLRTERLIGCKQPIPKWLSFLVGGATVSYVREVSEVDLVSKTLVMKSMNLTMNNLLLVKETVVYKPDDELPLNRTTFLQSAEITAFASLSKLCDKLEDWSVERFGQNAKTGKEAFEGVLNKLASKWEENGIFETNKILQEVKNIV
ncbi:Protein UPS2, mitochondrial [Candida viswanathii]|uniref:Protein UPS2, mitochondrial n=1 Tax=Candida viswanathii TaxID=5486 RepID=A0A367XUL3_9ASCO|nr:Protein UPS2, mitochondrial [Candida viswanathii]